MAPANFEVVESETTDECLVIRDIGPWERHKTVTNDVEDVVALLAREYVLKPGQRLEYYDSEGQRDQIFVSDGRFAGFGPKV